MFGFLKWCRITTINFQFCEHAAHKSREDLSSASFEFKWYCYGKSVVQFIQDSNVKRNVLHLLQPLKLLQLT